MRRAAPADVPELEQMLARAFMDDPVARWSCAPDRLRTRVLEGFNGGRLRQLLPHGEVWITDDRSCAALWAPPERWRTTWRDDLAMARGMMHLRLLARLPVTVAGLLGVERRHPRAPAHWYLAVLGTDPPAQGRGLGSAALQPVLERCDADGVGAYLESSNEDQPNMHPGATGVYLECSNEKNISFYERHGFKVTGEIRLPRGPTMWPMWRDPPKRP